MTNAEVARAKTEAIKSSAQASVDSLTDQQVTEEVNKIWDLVIVGFFLGDIQNLEQITLDEEKKYGLAAVGQLLSVTSMLELLGKTLYDGDELLYFKNHSEAWTYYFTHYLPEEYEILSEPIQNLLRHGAAHLFLPRQVGLSKRPGERLFFDENGTIIFNVTTFTNLFKDSLVLVKRDLDENPEVAKRFLRRYEQVRLTNQQVDTDKNFTTTLRSYIDSLPPISPIEILGVDIQPLPPTTTPPAQPFGNGVSTPPAHPISGSGHTPYTSSLGD
ncbi:hypothetical protein [Spirosoma pulveris]